MIKIIIFKMSNKRTEKQKAKYQSPDHDWMSRLLTKWEKQEKRTLAKGYVDFDVDYLDKYKLKKDEIIRGHLDVKVMELFPRSKTYCQARVGDQFGIILLNV